jgi:hypothetical protein
LAFQLQNSYKSQRMDLLVENFNQEISKEYPVESIPNQDFY